jgi:hypothetical protein
MSTIEWLSRVRLRGEKDAENNLFFLDVLVAGFRQVSARMPYRSMNSDVTLPGICQIFGHIRRV